MKAWTKRIAQLALTLCLVTSLINASEVGQSIPEDVRKSVGLKMITDEQRSSLEEQYAREATEENECQIQEKGGYSLYYPVDYSKFSVSSIGYQGTSVILSDDTAWSIRPLDGMTVKRWYDKNDNNYYGLTESKVYITINDSWLYTGQYLYRMVNMETGESALCKMVQGPAHTATIRIRSIDYYTGDIELIDYYGNYVVMNLAYLDENYYSMWAPNDRVIFGRNTKWDQFVNPYILINIELFTNARCDL